MFYFSVPLDLSADNKKEWLHSASQGQSRLIQLAVAGRLIDMNWKWAAGVPPWGMIGQMSPSSRASPQSQSRGGGARPLRLISRRQKHRVTRAANSDCHLNAGVGSGWYEGVESQSWSQSEPQRPNNKIILFHLLLRSHNGECEGGGSATGDYPISWRPWRFKALQCMSHRQIRLRPLWTLWKWSQRFRPGIGVHIVKMRLFFNKWPLTIGL